MNLASQSFDNQGRLAVVLALAALGAALAARPASADVTVQQQTSMSIAGMQIDMKSVERTSADKRRRDTTTQCHGFLALFCHNVQSGEIVRLDKQVEWQLEPKKKVYTERAFPTPEQRAQAQQQLQAAIEQMKKCPSPQAKNASQRGPDTSHCQLSPPVVNVKRTDVLESILGHEAHKTSVVLTQSCTDMQTGDVCEMDYGFDTWLTTDTMPGAAERRDFTRNYLTAQGLDPNDPQLKGMLQQLMAPYADALRQLQSKASDLQGYPLRTTFYMAFGGPHCGKARQAEPQQTSERRGGRFGFGSIASGAIRGGLGGLFHRGAGSIHTDSAAGAAAAGAANEAAQPTADAAADAATRPQSSAGANPGAAPTPPAGQLVQVVTLTTETTAIDTSSIPAGQFEIPPGWTLQRPKAQKASEFSCPATDR